jgi:ATP-dependent protease ClpP protease subunit
MKYPVFNYSSKQTTDDTLDVFIDGDIVDASTEQFYRDYFGDDTSTSYKTLRDSILSSNCNNINVHINSGGGQVADALAMHDFIVEQKAKGRNISTYGKGIVASAATYPLMAGGSNSHISKNAFFMIHNVSGQAYGTVDEIETTARMMRKMNNCIRDCYANATGKDASEIAEMMNDETWMTGEEACANGFVKNCDGTDNAITNSIPKEKWIYKNTTILNQINNSIPKQNEPLNMDNIKEAVTNGIKSAFEKLGFTNADKTVKISDVQNAIVEAMSGVLETEVKNTIVETLNAAITGDSFKELVANAINAKVAEATENVATKDELNALKDAIADKIATPAKPTNVTLPGGEGDEKDPAKKRLNKIKNAVETGGITIQGMD